MYKPENLPPAEQLVMTMNRIYEAGMTTSTGGNLSILDENGDIWITPSGIDKGSLTVKDICQVTRSGTVYGRHQASVELPFHAEIYRRSPDVRAVLHAHPPALVAFSAVRKLPDTRLTAGIYKTLGNITMASYAVPGSQDLGNRIAVEFDKNYRTVIMENHGVVIGDKSQSEAFIKLETLENAAKILINAKKTGSYSGIDDANLSLIKSNNDEYSGSLENTVVTEEEAETRKNIILFVRRCCRQKLFYGTEGEISVRLDDDSFIMTPLNGDRLYLEEGDLVRTSGGLHGKIYRSNGNINAIIGAAPSCLAAFIVTDALFDPLYIPESYIMLYKEPVILRPNDKVYTAGVNLFKAFDRMEVAEAAANSIIAAGNIGPMIKLNKSEIDEINRAFNPD